MNQNTRALFPARIARTSFFIRGVLLLCAVLLNGLLLSSSEHASILAKIVLIGGGAAVTICLCVVLFRSILIPRLRDIGWHPAWSLLILVHALNFFFLLALLVIPSNAFAKRSYWA